MCSWRSAKLGDMIELKRGYDLPKQDRLPGGTPIISSSGISGYHSQPMAKGPGVITGRYGTLGHVFYIEEDFWPLNTTLYVRNFKGNDPKFVSYFLRSLDFSAFSDKAAVPGLNRNHLHLAPIKFPTRPDEQRDIASILGCLDNKIETNLRMNETLEAMARAIFKDWFVDFGPTRAKMAGTKPYLAPEIWNLFPDSLDDEGKPKGWISSTIGQEVSVVGGTTPSTSIPSYWDGDLYWATPKDLSSLTSPVLLQTERRITPLGLTQIGSGLLPAGSVLLSSRAPIGYLAVSLVPTAINQGFIGMVCNSRLTNVFVWLWTKANMKTIHQKANGSTFQEISKANFRPIPVILPTDLALSAFEEIVRPLFKKICENERETRTLAAARDLILPKLMSGEVRVKEATKTVEAELELHL